MPSRAESHVPIAHCRREEKPSVAHVHPAGSHDQRWTFLFSEMASELREAQAVLVCLGTVIEVNVSELGLVTTSGKVVWGK
jgi:ribosomal protein S8E